MGALPAIHTPLRLLYSHGDRTVSVRDAETLRNLAVQCDVKVEFLAHSGHILPRDLERDQVLTWLSRQLAEWEASALSG